MSVHSKMTAIASAIRDKTGGTDPLTLDGMAEAIPQVFETGKQAGEAALWDVLQNYGNRTAYNGTFCASGFVHIDPKHPIKATIADNMMSQCRNLESVNWEKFDLSNAGSLYSAFAYCDKLKRIDTALGIQNGTATLMNSLARQSTSLESIQKIYALPVYVWKQAFEGCTSLTHVIFDGTIGANGLNLQWSTGLDRESIESIIHALSTTTSGLSISLSKTAVDNAFYNPDGEGSIGSESLEWTLLIRERENWTINLV